MAPRVPRLGSSFAERPAPREAGAKSADLKRVGERTRFDIWHLWQSIRCSGNDCQNSKYLILRLLWRFQATILVDIISDQTRRPEGTLCREGERGRSDKSLFCSHLADSLKERRATRNDVADSFSAVSKISTFDGVFGDFRRFGVRLERFVGFLVPQSDTGSGGPRS